MTRVRWKAVLALTALSLAGKGHAPFGPASAAKAADTRQQALKTGSALVLVAKASRFCFAERVRVNGFLMPRSEAIASLDLDGYQVTDVLAREGEQVGSGQVLARLSRLPGEGPGGPAAAPAAAAALLTIRAPAGGLIVRSTVAVGAVSAGRERPMFTIAVDGELELEGDVSSIHVSKLAPGQPARVEVTGIARELSGRVRHVGAEINQATQLGRVRVSIEGDASLRVGTFARATIDAARSCGIGVPRSALLNRGEGTSLMVVRDGRIETQSVRLGILSEDGAEVREGVAEGELVVAHAGASLRDGDKVSPIVAEDIIGGNVR